MHTLADRVEAFLARNPEVSATALGVGVVRDSALVSTLRAPQRGRTKARQPTETTIARVDAWMQNYEAAKKRRATAELRAARAAERKAARRAAAGG